jgi:hypothetical protein
VSQNEKLPALNTDRELWREKPGDYYSDSIHVTEGGGIGLNCGGCVIVMPIRKWHALAEAAPDSVGSPQKSEFSAQAAADGWWEIYHDDDCGGIITPYPENLCLRCGMHPDLQSRGARRTSKAPDSVGEAPPRKKPLSEDVQRQVNEAVDRAQGWVGEAPAAQKDQNLERLLDEVGIVCQCGAVEEWTVAGIRKRLRAAMHAYGVATGRIEPDAAPAQSLYEAAAPTQLTPHSSVIHTDLKVRCHDCGGYQIWRYLEDEDTIEVFHDCMGGKKAREMREAGRQEGWEAGKSEIADLIAVIGAALTMDHPGRNVLALVYDRIRALTPSPEPAQKGKSDDGLQ